MTKGDRNNLNVEVEKMSIRFNTEKTRYHLTLKERADGTPFFMLEPYEAELSFVQLPGWPGIELRPGTTFKQAEEIGHLLVQHFWGLSYARPEEGPDEGGEQ
jgi:hypothetical protein